MWCVCDINNIIIVNKIGILGSGHSCMNIVMDMRFPGIAFAFCVVCGWALLMMLALTPKFGAPGEDTC